MRGKVGHCFHVVKCHFKHCKTRYRGLTKNNAKLFTLFGLASLVLGGLPLYSLLEMLLSVHDLAQPRIFAAPAKT